MEAVVEAILFVANDPVSRAKLAEVFDESEKDEAEAAIDAVVERWTERPEHGVVMDDVAGGLRLVTRPDLHDYLRRFFEVSNTNKLSMAALETLAIVAYRQPVTAPEIQELRGVNSAGVLKTLLERRMVRIAGRKEVVGKPFLYATTREFLLHFGLRSLKELPPLEQFEEIFADEAVEGEGGEDAEETADREALELAEQAAEEAAKAAAEQEEFEREEEEARQAEKEAEAGIAGPDEAEAARMEEDAAPSPPPEPASAASTATSARSSEGKEVSADGT